MKSKINFRQRKLAEQKSLVLILDPKTGRKKKKWKQAVPSECWQRKTGERVNTMTETVTRQRKKGREQEARH